MMINDIKIVLFVFAIFLIFGALSYIDMKRDYSNIQIFKRNDENGQFYFFIPFYIWQSNKVRRANDTYTQNTILEFSGYKYQITNFGGAFSIPKGLFFEKELRYWGEPLRTVWSQSNLQLTINQYGSGNVSINLNDNKYIGDIVNIRDYLAQDTIIENRDKEIMEDFIDKILYQKSMEKEEVKNAYGTFIKYEPLLSFAVNILSVIKDFLV